MKYKGQFRGCVLETHNGGDGGPQCNNEYLNGEEGSAPVKANESIPCF